jgi:UDP-N-acetylmuramoylalanine--D-glutamate ligase
MDRHGTFEAYCAAKENIFRLQKRDRASPAISIFNADDPIAAQWYDTYCRQEGRRCLTFSADDVPASIRERFALPGRANLSNLAAALVIARQYGLTDEAIGDSLIDFKPLPHRLEPVGTVDGVGWYNDSIATTPQSAIVALEAFDAPRIVIAGGYDKNLPFDELGRAIARRAKAAVLIGATASKIADAVRVASAVDNTVRVEMAGSLEEAVQLAHHLAVPGDVVLLSPACASYDMFDNFQHRGDRFVELVRELRRRL